MTNKEENTDKLSLVECPRDAMQGWPHFIPTATKVQYLNQLLQVGFDVLDCGSFVSPKAIPQMADTKEVLPQLDMGDGATKLLTIIANLRGAQEAMDFEQISYLGFPFSISETFQLRNTQKTIAASLHEVEEIQRLCEAAGKELVIYISMGFGNPYGDEYNEDTVQEWVEKIAALGIGTFAISDTVGVARPAIITSIFQNLIPAFPALQIGAHYHSTPATRMEKLDAAWQAGCRRMDSAILGIGGCPMAKDDLVGNMATEDVIKWCFTNEVPLSLDEVAFSKAQRLASAIFQ